MQFTTLAMIITVIIISYIKVTVKDEKEEIAKKKAVVHVVE